VFTSLQELGELIAPGRRSPAGHLQQPSGREAPEEFEGPQDRRQQDLGARRETRPDGSAPDPGAAAPEAAVKPKANKKAKGGAQAANVEGDGPREGSKMAQVIAMLQRKGRATITEIRETMSWQRHTVRKFMAGAMKKTEYASESFKPEEDERSFRLPK